MFNRIIRFKKMVNEGGVIFKSCFLIVEQLKGPPHICQNVFVLKIKIIPSNIAV